VGRSGRFRAEFGRGTFPELFECTHRFSTRTRIVMFRPGALFRTVLHSLLPWLPPGHNYLEISKIDTDFTVPRLFFSVFRRLACSSTQGRRLFRWKYRLFQVAPIVLLASTVRGRTSLSFQPVHFLQRLFRRMPSIVDDKQKHKALIHLQIFVGLKLG
jgi:hypothetical protein